MTKGAAMNAPAPRSYTAALPSAGGRDLAVDCLRSLVILLVVFLHASLAYASFAVYDPAHYIDATTPVVDSSRWPPLDLPIMFIDSFAMPLLFLVSGLFVFAALDRKGSSGFFLARLKRLGIPFAVAAFTLSPLAFWPGFLRSTPDSSVPYWIRFFTSDGWLIGAPWFLWVLLVFDGIVALVYKFAPAAPNRLRRGSSPWLLLLAAGVAFVPPALFFSPFAWLTRIGPFDVQPVRLPLFFVFFLFGMALSSARRLESGWPKRWGLWLLFGLFSFAVYIFIGKANAGLALRAVYSLGFAGACAGLSLGLLGAFHRLIKKASAVISSLNDNSFGIYLFHYPIVHWIQYFLLPLAWPAPLKLFMVFFGGLAIAWGASALVRKIPLVRRII
jgi:glucan biosynthesis protein C